MQILFLTENFPPEVNASATRVFERACYWVRWGHQVTVITSFPNFPQGKLYPGYRNQWYKVEETNGIRVVRVKTFVTRNEGIFLRMLDFTSFMATAFIAGLFQTRPDVVMATSPQFFAAVGGWAVAGARSLPFVFELGDLWPASITAVGAMKPNLILDLMERLELFLYRRSAAIVALTDSFRKDLVRRRIPREKIAVVVNGVDLPRYEPQPRSKELADRWGIGDEFVVGYIGTHGMAHALEKVLDAAAILSDFGKIRFLFVGDGAAKQMLVREAAERMLANVTFIPPQPKEAMPDFWSLCDVALVNLKDTPVFSTVIPSKIFEAMGMGLPIILAAPEGEASRIILEENAGLHIPPEDPQRLAEAVLALRNGRREYTEYAGNSLAASSKYTRERQAKEVLEVLKRVADED